MSAPRFRAAAILLGLGLVVTPALSGCIPSVDDLVGGLVQQGVQAGLEQATGLDYEVGALPAGFPSEVPLADGELVGGVAVNNDDGSKGWSVMMATDRSQDEIQAQLEAAGFAPFEGAGDFALPGMVMLENNQYMVTATVGKGEADGGKNSVMYLVIVKGE